MRNKTRPTRLWKENYSWDQGRKLYCNPKDSSSLSWKLIKAKVKGPLICAEFIFSWLCVIIWSLEAIYKVELRPCILIQYFNLPSTWPLKRLLGQSTCLSKTPRSKQLLLLCSIKAWSCMTKIVHHSSSNNNEKLVNNFNGWHDKNPHPCLD